MARTSRPKACGCQASSRSGAGGCGSLVAASHTTTPQAGGMLASMNTRCHVVAGVPLSISWARRRPPSVVKLAAVPLRARLGKASGHSGSAASSRTG